MSAAGLEGGRASRRGSPHRTLSEGRAARGSEGRHRGGGTEAGGLERDWGSILLGIGGRSDRGVERLGDDGMRGDGEGGRER